MQNYRLFLSITILLSLTLSCSTPKLGYSQKGDSADYFTEYDNHMLFKFRSNITLYKDKETYKPALFDIELPKNIKYWEVINNTNFGFYYSQDQVIFITTEKIKNLPELNIYMPTEVEIEALISDSFKTSSNHKWDIKGMPIIPSRRNFLIKVEGTYILLFNIKEKNFETFLNLAKSLKIIS